jgi:iron complex transport system substrate-binding protein
MPRSRQLLPALIGLVALLAGACGSETDSAPGADSGSADTTRTVQHAMGNTDVSGTPQRVVVLDTGELDSVLALGVTPVGAVRADATTGQQSYLAERTQDVAVVGTIGEPNLEAIASLQPDLILSNKVRHEALYSQLSQIAPTVFAEKVGVAWKENFQLAAEALGKQAEAQRILAAYEQNAKQVGEAFGDPSQLEVSMVRFMSGSIRLYGEGSFIGTVLHDAGFARPASQQVDKTFVEVSQEQINQAEGDILFYAAYGNPDETNQAEVTAGPLWQRLDVVSAGKAHEVSDDLWYLGIGPIAADLILKDLTEYAPIS